MGKSYSWLGNYDTSYNHIQEAYQLFNTLALGEIESQRLGGLYGIDLVENADFISQADKVVSLAWHVERKCAALSDNLVH